MTPGLFLLTALLAAAEPAPAPAAALERLELGSGDVLEGRAAEFRDGVLVFRTASGEQRVAPAEVARLVRWPARPVGRTADGLVTAGGDVLEGQVLDLDKGRVHLDSPRYGALELDAKQIRAFFFGRELAEAAAAARGQGAAELVLLSGSRTPAELRWIQGDKLGFQSPLGALDVKRKDLSWVFLPAKPPEKAGAGQLRLRLSAGETLTGKLLDLSGGRVRLAWNGRELQVPWDQVRALESPDEHMVYLSALQPAAAKYEAAVGPVRPLAADQSAALAPLCLAGTVYERGLGMRARTEVGYRLDGKWKRFRALAGLDSEAARASRGAVFKVIGDGKALFEKQVAPGDPPAAVDLDIGGVKDLVLVLEPGPGFEVGDYGDWADARLLR
jgi:hypothetical protein